jgi:hypothetical protein
MNLDEVDDLKEYGFEGPLLWLAYTNQRPDNIILLFI